MKLIRPFAAVVSILALVVSCQKNLNSQPSSDTKTIEYETPETIKGDVAFLGSSAIGYIGESIASICGSIVADPESADILIVKSAELEANKEIIGNAFEEGRTVVEIEPDNTLHSAFWTSIKAVPYLDPAENENDLIIIALRKNACYQLQSPFDDKAYIAEGKPTEDETATESTNEEKNNYTAEPVSIGKNVEFFSTKLCRFASWLNEVNEVDETNDLVPSFDGELAKRLTDSKYTFHFTKTLNVGANNFRICKIILSDPDVVTRHSTVDVDIYVTPLYAFELNGSDKRGDYYFVTTKLASHNKQLYGLYRRWHGWVVTHSHIFYSKNLKLDVELQDKNGKALSTSVLSFEETPKPTTTASSTSYTTGLNKSLNLNGQIGITGGNPTATLTVGGTFTWINTQTKNVKDFSIEMSTDPNSRKVCYQYLTNNDKMEDKTEDAVPGIGRTDEYCDGAWCWHVYNTKDDDAATFFKLKVYFEPNYGYMWRHATWTVEGWSRITCLLDDKLRNISFNCPIPNRRRMGVAEIKSTNREYMYGLKILDKAGNVIAKDPGAYEKNQIQRYQIPVGTYNIEYEIRNGDTGAILGKYRISDVVITTGATTVKSTIDGKKI